MPPVRKLPKKTNGGVPSGEVSPEEAAAIRAVAEGRETAPSTREQSSGVDWKKVQNQLGQPFNTTRIPLDKLELMRRDAIIGFGLSFIKTPIARANWMVNAKSIDGPNAQIAAHLDHDLRRIWASTIFTWGNSLDFGFQAIVKRYELGRPAGTYVQIDPDTGEETETPIWDEGNIDPIRWKPFVALPPGTVEPVYDGQGGFGGISYTPPSVGGGAAQTTRKYKVEQSLWVTNEKESVFGSLFGYPRIGYAYPFWWSYWFRWAIADRAFEKRADPSTLVRHPEGSYTGANGDVIDYRELALMIGEQMRSGASIAMPSSVYSGDIDGKPSTVPEWDIEFLTGGVNMEPFDASFDYLDVAKLRALWIPEQAFFEGKGGTSSRNVASQQYDNFTEQQELLKLQVVEMYNRWIIPQWLAINYPEFVAAGGSAEVIVKSFADKDVALQTQVLQLVGQQESGQREMLTMIDLRRLLEEAGTPLVSFAEQKARENQIAAQQQATAPPPTDPIPGQSVGVVPTATGFSYIQPREIIYLSENSGSFLEKLPDSPHYQDRTIKRYSRALWETWRDAYREDYDDFARFIEDEESITLADESDDFFKRAQAIVKKWRRTRDIGSVIDRSTDSLRKIIDRASAIAKKEHKLATGMPEEDIANYIDLRSNDTLVKVFDTTSDELSGFLALQLRNGVTDSRELSQRVRDHFSDFADWKADRLVRTEVRDAYNAATLYSANADGVEVFQAADAQDGDTDADCKARDGKLFPFKEALNVTEHPNGTLYWKPLKRNVSIARVAASEDDPVARFDSETGVVYFSDAITPEQERLYMDMIVERVNS